MTSIYLGANIKTQGELVENCRMRKEKKKKTTRQVKAWVERLKRPPQRMQRSGGGERRGLGPRNDVLTTCKAVNQRGGQRITTVFLPQ